LWRYRARLFRKKQRKVFEKIQIRKESFSSLKISSRKILTFTGMSGKIGRYFLVFSFVYRAFGEEMQKMPFVFFEKARYPFL